MGGGRDDDAPRQRALGAGALLVAAAVVALLVVAASGYGYHRDELYFLEAGQHLAWGYADQPPLTPFLARLMTALAPGSLVLLRLPSALAAGGICVLTALIARDLGASRVAQTLAAACMAASSLLMAVAHLHGTSSFDMLAWTALTWVVIRILRGGDQRLWLVAGAIAGVGLMNKLLVGFLVAGLLAGILVSGPRDVLRTRWFLIGGVLAALLWLPNLIWQAANGWPQLDLASAIAAGSSGTSEPVALFVPFQLVLVSPVLVPIWVWGLVRYLRDPALRSVRAVGIAYPLLAVAFMATGGKPYYIGGLYPALLAAGSAPVVEWARKGQRRVRMALLSSAVVLAAIVSAVLMLPIVPATSLHATPIVDINYDAGETIGWPQFVETVADVYRRVPAADRARTVIVTANYGQAGAVDHYGSAYDLPRAYSGHNSYAYWGSPPAGSSTAVVVGFDEAFLRSRFANVELAARVDNGVGLDNDEQGTPVWICREPRADWPAMWDDFTRLG